MTKKIFIITVLAVFSAGCNGDMMGDGGMMGGHGMMGDIDISGNPPPPESNPDYAQGYRQAKITCTQCHAMPHPDQHSSDEWPGVIARMEDHIKTYHKQVPSKERLKSIVEYYAGNSD